VRLARRRIAADALDGGGRTRRVALALVVTTRPIGRVVAHGVARRECAPVAIAVHRLLIGARAKNLRELAQRAFGDAGGGFVRSAFALVEPRVPVARRGVAPAAARREIDRDMLTLPDEVAFRGSCPDATSNSRAARAVPCTDGREGRGAAGSPVRSRRAGTIVQRV